MDTICICGEAGSGKDTVADLLRGTLGGVKIALADPMKRLVQALMRFTDDQLWGPSESRNAVDERMTPGFIVEVIVRVLSSEHTQEKRVLTQLLGFCPDPSSARSAFLGWLRFMAEKAESGPLSPRVVLQTLGTEFGRAVDPRLWIRIGIFTRDQLLAGGYEYTPQEGLIPTLGANVNLVFITDCRFRNEVLAFNALGALMLRVLTGKALPPAIHASELEQRSIPDNWFYYVIHNRKSDGMGALRRMILALSSSWAFTADDWSTGGYAQ